LAEGKSQEAQARADERLQKAEARQAEKSALAEERIKEDEARNEELLQEAEARKSRRLEQRQDVVRERRRLLFRPVVVVASVLPLLRSPPVELVLRDLGARSPWQVVVDLEQRRFQHRSPETTTTLEEPMLLRPEDLALERVEERRGQHPDEKLGPRDLRARG